MNLKILCQNMKYAACKKIEDPNITADVRRHRFQWLVKKYDPDIIGMQEVDELWRSMLREDFREEYDMYYLYRGSLKGSNEAEPVMWKKDKFEKVEEGSFWLSETPDTPYPPGFDQYYPRICNWVRLKEIESGRIIRIGSTHFGFYEDNEPIKIIRGLFERKCEIAGEEPYLFMGDFNIFYSYNYQNPYNVLRFIFGGMEDVPYEELPRDSSLRRAYADWLIAGNPVGFGRGAFIWDEENNTVRK